MKMTNDDIFDSHKIERQLDQVKSVIDKIEFLRPQTANDNLVNKFGKVKTSHSTRADSMNSPNSVNLGEYYGRNKMKT